jgi:DNA-binding beta-propeller fold protein YncE
MMKKILSRLLIGATTAIFIITALNSLHAAYNNECWVVSNGDKIYKIYPDGQADPNAIEFPDVSQAQTAEVDPKTGVVWIAVSAANTVFRYDPAIGDFKSIPNINRPQSISINPKDNTVWVAGFDVVKKISADGSQILAEITDVHEPSVAVNTSDGSCWVTHSRGQIFKHDASGARIVTSPVSLTEPKYVTVNPKTGNVWVADPQANILVKLDTNGQELLRVTDLQLPTTPRINPKDGTMWVVASSNTLVKFNAAGQKAQEFPGVGMAILSISIDPDGGVWVADQFGSTFQGGVSKFTAAGQKLFENAIPLPSSVSVGNWGGQ